MKTSIYIKDSDAVLFERAQKDLGESLSSLVADCVKTRLAELDRKTDDIIVETYTADDQPRRKKKFSGRWIVWQLQPMNDDDGVHRGSELISVALTKKGAIAVYSLDERRDTATLETYADFEEFESATIDNRYPMYPMNVVAAVREGLGMEPEIEELDI